MHRSHNQVALHRRTGDFSKLAKQLVLALVTQRQGAHQQLYQLGAVTQQKEGQIDHQRQAGEETQCALAKLHRVLCKETAGGDGSIGCHALDAFQVDAQAT